MQLVEVSLRSEDPVVLDPVLFLRAKGPMRAAAILVRELSWREDKLFATLSRLESERGAFSKFKLPLEPL